MIKLKQIWWRFIGYKLCDMCGNKVLPTNYIYHNGLCKSCWRYGSDVN